MKQRLTALVGAILLLATLAGCGKTVVVHCDRCGAEIKVSESSGITEDWILFCQDCAKEVEPEIN